MESVVVVIAAVLGTVVSEVSEVSVPFASNVTFTCRPKFTNGVQLIRWLRCDNQSDIPVPVYTGNVVTKSFVGRFTVAVVNYTTSGGDGGVESRLSILGVKAEDSAVYACRELTSSVDNFKYALTVIVGVQTTLENLLTTTATTSPTSKFDSRKHSSTSTFQPDVQNVSTYAGKNQQLLHTTDASAVHFATQLPLISKPVTQKNEDIPYMYLAMIGLATVAIICVTVIVVVLALRCRGSVSQQSPTTSTWHPLLTNNTSYNINSRSDDGMYIHPPGDGNGHYSEIALQSTEAKRPETTYSDELLPYVDSKLPVRDLDDEKRLAEPSLYTRFIKVGDGDDAANERRDSAGGTADETTLIKIRDEQ